MLGSEVEKATKFGLAKDGSGVGGECVDERNGGQQLTPVPPLQRPSVRFKPRSSSRATTTRT